MVQGESKGEHEPRSWKTCSDHEKYTCYNPTIYTKCFPVFANMQMKVFIFFDESYMKKMTPLSPIKEVLKVKKGKPLNGCVALLVFPVSQVLFLLKTD